jgi:hypothetical protein
MKNHQFIDADMLSQTLGFLPSLGLLLTIKYEEAQGTTVKAEDGTQHKSQPDFISHTTGPDDRIGI